MKIFASLALALALVLSGTAFAVQPDELLKDPKLESRARKLSEQLRCMVCQNQSIDDSDAPLARDLRVLVRERLKSGESDDAIMKYLADRYGDFILLNPPVKSHTLLLWGSPLLVLVLGGAGILMALRRRQQQAAPVVAALSDEEKARLEAMLKADQT